MTWATEAFPTVNPVNVPKLVILACALPAVVIVVAYDASLAFATVPVTLAPVILPNVSPSPMKCRPCILPYTVFASPKSIVLFAESNCVVFVNANSPAV